MFVSFLCLLKQFSVNFFPQGRRDIAQWFATLSPLGDRGLALLAVVLGRAWTMLGSRRAATRSQKKVHYPGDRLSLVFFQGSGTLC